MAITTTATQLLGVQHPIMLAGMGSVSTPSLAAAVSNAGGFGCIGGVGYTPAMLKELLVELKSKLRDPSLPFGVDLLIPQIGGSARKTNVDYTRGTLDALIDVIIDSGAKLFVSAVGLPPRHVVEKLHKAGVLYMNMIGHPKHVHKACQNGADLICAQGGEAGGHTGDTPTSVLIPACADICKQYTSPLTGQPPLLVAAGGIADGRGLAAMLMMGASAVWLGTRFIVARESGATKDARDGVWNADFDSTIKSTIWTGRPLRNLKTRYVENWETNRREELKELQDRGITALDHDLDALNRIGQLTEEIEDQSIMRPMGVVAALVPRKEQGAGEIVHEIVKDAATLLNGARRMVTSEAKL